MARTMDATLGNNQKRRYADKQCADDGRNPFQVVH